MWSCSESCSRRWKNDKDDKTMNLISEVNTDFLLEVNCSARRHSQAVQHACQVEKNKRIRETFCGQIQVLFLVQGQQTICQMTPSTEFKPQYTVKTVKHCGANIIWKCFSSDDVSHNYRISGITAQFACIKLLEGIMFQKCP